MNSSEIGFRIFCAMITVGFVGLLLMVVWDLPVFKTISDWIMSLEDRW